MKQTAFITSIIIATLLACSGCESNRNAKVSRGLTVTGKIGEILVVCDQGIWESDIKECLDSNLTQWIMPYFPDVATFELAHRTPAHFTQGVKRYRNTLFLKIDPEYKGAKGSIVKRSDVWAIGQLVVDVTAKDYNQLVETCKKGLGAVHDEFDEVEWKRLIRYFKQNQSTVVREKIQENFGIDLALPSNTKIVTKRTNFYRLEFPPASRPIEFLGTGTQDVGSIFSGLMIYQYNYSDSSQFDMDQLLMARDTMLKYNVPDEVEGMYMGTQYEKFVQPEGNPMVNEKETIHGFEMRGMFKFTGRPIHRPGGAFWAFHFVNPETKKMICLSGYVDAPSTTSWTHPLREVQAILRSVEFKK